MFKIYRFNCCGLDVHKTWIYACIGITNKVGLTEYKQQRFSSFSRGLRELAAWVQSFGCKEVCMESAGKYWIPVFNILESDYPSNVTSRFSPRGGASVTASSK